eukprot:gene5788-7284_t
MATGDKPLYKKRITKFTQSYERIWKKPRLYHPKNELPSTQTQQQQFWDELFLLKVHPDYLHTSIKKFGIEGVVAHVEAALHLLDESDIRVGNALLTLGILIKSIYHLNPSRAGYRITHIMFAPDHTDTDSKVLFEGIEASLQPGRAMHLRQLSLQILVVMLAGSANINENDFADLFMQHVLFDSICMALKNSHDTQVLGNYIVYLLAILCQYRRNEFPNPYLANIQATADELLLHNQLDKLTLYCTQNLSNAILYQLSAKVNCWVSQTTLPETSSVFSTVATFMSDMFVSSDVFDKRVHVHRCGAPLFLLYLFAFCHTQALTIFSHTEVLAQFDNQQMFCVLLSVLLLSSCMTQDDHINAYLHDSNIKAPFYLRRAEMRHRGTNAEIKTQGPMATSIFDLCIEYIISHMTRSLELHTYRRCLEVIHRLLCYQKNKRVRLNYDWESLWTSLTGLLKFIIQNKEHFLATFDVFDFISKIITIINLFITYGDTFLPDPNTYDLLYYEIIRERKHYDTLKDLATRHRLFHEKYADSAARIDTEMCNIRDIIDHFAPKIAAWLATNKEETLDPDRVLGIVRENYETLTLKLQDSLDKYDRYTEGQSQMALMTRISRNINNAFADIKLTPPPSIRSDGQTT